MRILLVNDDGIHAEGINKLAMELEKKHEVIVVAPSDERSAQSHALTLRKPLIVKEIKLEGINSRAYSVSGTPADCVRIALDQLIKEPVDIVISGINKGLNVGMDVLYSGTVSAAIEANLYGIPSMALSAEWYEGNINYDVAIVYGRIIFEKMKDELLKNKMIININTPYMEVDEVKGIKVCRVGGVVYDYYIMEGNGKNGQSTFKAGGRENRAPEEDTDRFYIAQGYVTVTPLQYNLTNFDLIDKVESWL
ncbi:MAG: 5'/3'-nucleotidase SurE [Tissierellia bacterium]|nr:5'/3'-nucleotidase SurE [Tissierellia bacterium]